MRGNDDTRPQRNAERRHVVQYAGDISASSRRVPLLRYSIIWGRGEATTRRDGDATRQGGHTTGTGKRRDDTTARAATTGTGKRRDDTTGTRGRRATTGTGKQSTTQPGRASREATTGTSKQSTPQPGREAGRPQPGRARGGTTQPGRRAASWLRGRWASAVLLSCHATPRRIPSWLRVCSTRRATEGATK